MAYRCIDAQVMLYFKPLIQYNTKIVSAMFVSGLMHHFLLLNPKSIKNYYNYMLKINDMPY